MQVAAGVVAVLLIVGLVGLMGAVTVLTAAPWIVVRFLMPRSVEWSMYRGRYGDWEWKAQVGEESLKGESLLPIKGPAVLHMLISVYRQMMGAKWKGATVTAPCLICEQPSLVGELTCGRDCQRRLEAAKTELP